MALPLRFRASEAQHLLGLAEEVRRHGAVRALQVLLGQAP